ncbi:hypothetical protein ACSAZL_03180 [Methanosarcina sp. T3]|uniref:hypothetical protein n=1 Tax=Methanosarcina sp. T3 TaxID=3439062 RepID=UPI003F85CC14
MKMEMQSKEAFQDCLIILNDCIKYNEKDKNKEKFNLWNDRGLTQEMLGDLENSVKAYDKALGIIEAKIKTLSRRSDKKTKRKIKAI